MSCQDPNIHVTEADHYYCSLSASTQNIAREELGETASSRFEALAELRIWLEQHPKFISVRMDSNFLLRFLRAKKFSVPMAQVAMERYLLLRQCWGIAFNDLDYKQPVMMELLDLGYIFVSPFKDKGGRRVIIYRPGVINPSKYTNIDLCRAVGICYETLMEYEENQVLGVVHFIDGKRVSYHHLMLFAPIEAARLLKNGEYTLPMRHKEIYGINVRSTLKIVVEVGMDIISEKIRKRVRMYRRMEGVEIEPHLLPLEYGGVMPMKEMIDLWKQELESKRNILMVNDHMKVRVNMYSEAERIGTLSALEVESAAKEDAEADENDINIMAGIIGELEID